MIIDGKAIAEAILTHLTQETALLKSRGITPTMAVIQVGDNPASLAYIRQKQKAAERIGATVVLHHVSGITKAELAQLVGQYNADAAIHGLIIQRPLPQELGDVSAILDSVVLPKDIDGFLPNSPYDVPVAVAVGEMLRNVHDSEFSADADTTKTRIHFLDWLKTKNIAIIGRGSTAGAPIRRYFEKLHCATSVIHSHTPDPDTLLRHADIIVSCVGKREVVTQHAVKTGAILISVGIWRDEQGKLHGDYEPEDISDNASYYTPTPGGVGPVNVACLMQNLVKACTMA